MAGLYSNGMYDQEMDSGLLIFNNFYRAAICSLLYFLCKIVIINTFLDNCSIIGQVKYFGANIYTYLAGCASFNYPDFFYWHGPENLGLI